MDDMTIFSLVMLGIALLLVWVVYRAPMGIEKTTHIITKAKEE